MTGVVIITPHELRALIRTEVRAALTEGIEREAAEWLDTRSAAELLKVHPRTVARMAQRGEVPSSRIGRLLRFERRELLAWLEHKRTSAR